MADKRGSSDDRKMPDFMRLVDYSAVQGEVLRKQGLGVADDFVGFEHVLRYKFENFVSSNSNAPFYVLCLITLLCILIFGRVWQAISTDPDTSFWHGCWLSFQIIVAQGADDKIREAGHVFYVFCLLLCGMIIFAVLIGMITDAFQNAITNIAEGKTAVAASGHTLILGWNEATLRTICQIAFLRRQWRLLNSTFLRKWLLIGRIAPSTPLAKEPIVIMCKCKTKEEMEDEIRAAFADRGISPKRTKLGWDVVCRTGDPSDIQDLIRVGAARATSIMVQMTDEDDREEQTYDGQLPNGMTLRTLLALRYVFFSATKPPNWDNLRIVVQLARPSKVMQAASFHAPNGRRVVLLQDLSRFLNNLMFTCTAQPGLADVLLDVMGFEGVAIRARRADTFPDKGASIIGKSVVDASFAWEDAVFLGVIGKDGDAIKPGVVNLDEGICPRASRVVVAEDRIIFLSASAAPKVLKSPPTQAGRRPSGRRSSVLSKKMNILVCGWRPEWNNPDRWRFRLQDTLGRLEQGSHMTFMVPQSLEEFSTLMKEANIPDMAVTDDGWFYGGWVTIGHRQGEPCMVEELEPVLLDKLYDRAIILSDHGLSPYSRDTKVMQVMLLLRWLQEQHEQPAMSVVAENALNQTAQLAVAPADESGHKDPDFVNMQAIQARALTQCLAYPRIEPAISELFSCLDKSPDIVMRAISDYVPSGTEIPFYQLQEKIKDSCPEDICIGWRMKSSQIVVGPKADDVLKAENGGFLIVLTRSDEEMRLASTQGVVEEEQDQEGATLMV